MSDKLNIQSKFEDQAETINCMSRGCSTITFEQIQYGSRPPS